MNIYDKLRDCIVAKEEYQSLSLYQQCKVMSLAGHYLYEVIGLFYNEVSNEILEEVARVAIEAVRNQQDDERLTVSPTNH